MCPVRPGREIRAGQNGDQWQLGGQEDLTCLGESGRLPVGVAVGPAGRMGSLSSVQTTCQPARGRTAAAVPLVLPVPQVCRRGAAGRIGHAGTSGAAAAALGVRELLGPAQGL